MVNEYLKAKKRIGRIRRGEKLGRIVTGGEGARKSKSEDREHEE